MHDSVKNLIIQYLRDRTLRPWRMGRLAGAAGLMLLPLTVPGQPPGAGGEGPPPAPVVTARVQAGSYVQPIQLTGNVEPRRHTTLAAEQQGVLTVLHVDEGDEVTTGTLLAEVRRTALELALEHSEAEYLADKATLDELLAGTRPEDIRQREAEVAETRAELVAAQRDLARFERLLREGSVSESQFDTVKLHHDTLEAQLASRQAALERAQSGPRAEEIAKARADMEASFVQVQARRLDLELTRLRAPYAGVITRKHIDVGSWVSPGQPLLDIEEIDTVRVRFEVPEVYFNQVATGSTIQVSFDAAPGKRFDGTLVRIIPRADIRSRAFPVLVNVQNASRELAPGMIARIRLEPRQDHEQATIVSRDALVAQGPVPVVFRVVQTENGEIAERLEVHTGRHFGEAVEVFGELRPGDRVVVRGNERLQPGQRVRTSPYAPLPGVMGNGPDAWGNGETTP